MATKIIAFFALLAISASVTSAYILRMSALAATASPLYWPQATSIVATHPWMQLQALASGIFAPLAILQQ
jgi:hypothetical protein